METCLDVCTSAGVAWTISFVARIMNLFLGYFAGANKYFRAHFSYFGPDAALSAAKGLFGPARRYSNESGIQNIGEPDMVHFTDSSRVQYIYDINLGTT